VVSFLMYEPLFAIADGLGGHIAGDVASSTAVEVIAGQANNADPNDPNSLVAIVRGANAAIWEKAQDDPALRGMGTTCTLLMIDDSSAHLAHVGDSRAYLYRSGELSQLTEDHTLVWRMVREGRLSAEEAEHHPQRNIITRALGMDSNIDVDILSFDLVPGDRLLLCSDGLTSMVDAERIRQTLDEERDAQRAADTLVELANKAGGEDNVTVVVLDVVDSAGAPPPPPREADTGAMQAVSENPSAPARPPEGDSRMHLATAAPKGGRPRYWLRRLVIAVALLGVLGVAGVLLIRWQLGNSYFVGVGEDGVVTIYRGRPEEVAWISLRSEAERTDLTLTELPEFMRDDLEEGIKTDSLEEAQQRVQTLEEQAESFRQEGTAGQKKKN
jgi:serine/threonine protein phosphatase PrpC